MVQIAAVSSQDVADILLASLQKKGYSVSVRHEPQDKLLHVQIGPFATRKDAEAMQQRCWPTASTPSSNNYIDSR